MSCTTYLRDDRQRSTTFRTSPSSPPLLLVHILDLPVLSETFHPLYHNFMLKARATRHIQCAIPLHTLLHHLRVQMQGRLVIFRTEHKPTADELLVLQAVDNPLVSEREALFWAWDRQRPPDEAVVV